MYFSGDVSTRGMHPAAITSKLEKAKGVTVSLMWNSEMGQVWQGTKKNQFLLCQEHVIFTIIWFYLYQSM